MFEASLAMAFMGIKAAELLRDPLLAVPEILLLRESTLDLLGGTGGLPSAPAPLRPLEVESIASGGVGGCVCAEPCVNVASFE